MPSLPHGLTVNYIGIKWPQVKMHRTFWEQNMDMKEGKVFVFFFLAPFILKNLNVMNVLQTPTIQSTNVAFGYNNDLRIIFKVNSESLVPKFLQSLQSYISYMTCLTFRLGHVMSLTYFTFQQLLLCQIFITDHIIGHFHI